MTRVVFADTLSNVKPLTSKSSAKEVLKSKSHVPLYVDFCT